LFVLAPTLFATGRAMQVWAIEHKKSMKLGIIVPDFDHLRGK
jgi:hypothetical protein